MKLIKMTRAAFIIEFIVVACVGLGGCTPRVELAPSKEPITVNLNVKIDHEVRVKVEKDLEEVISPDSKLF